MGVGAEKVALPGDSARRLPGSWLLKIALAGAILYGLAAKLYLSLSFSLNSDMVVPGLMARELWEHHNYLLADFYLPAHDTYIFTDVVPFHLIPQILTGYDPVALKLTGYAIFILLLAAFSLLVYRISRSLTSALILAALGANLNPAAYSVFAVPDNHVATAFFCVVLLLIALSVNPVGQATGAKHSGQSKTSGKRQKPGPGDDGAAGSPRSTRSWPATALALLFPALAFLVAFSDTLVILWFVLPYVLAYLLFYREKTTRSDGVTLSLVLATGLAYVLKMLVPSYVNVVSQVHNVSSPSETLPLYLSDLWYLLSPGISPVLQGSPLGFYELIGLGLLIAAAGLSVFAAVRHSDGRAKFLYITLLLSAAIITVTYLFSSYAGGLDTSRYLSFTAMSAFGVIALGYSVLSGRTRLVHVSVVLLILAASVVGSYLALGSVDPEPNKGEYDLLKKLESQGIDHGYGTYWVANNLTYLSGEKVTIRPVTFTRDGRVVPNYWNSCGGWYTYEPADTYLVVDSTTMSGDEQQKLRAALGKANSTELEPTGKYQVFRLSQFQLSGFT